MNCRTNNSQSTWTALCRGFCAFVVVTAAAVAPLASAQAANETAYDTSNAIDPPGRVGRLSDVIGQVWMFSPGSGEWVAAVRNRPLTSGDRLTTDAGARAELRIGSTTLRLDAGSELEVLQLDDNRMALQLHSGSTAVRLRQRETAAQFELRTAEGRFRVQRTGRYRFDRQDDTSHVTVYSGQAYFEGPGSALAVGAGQRAEFWLDNRNAAQYSLTEPVRDAFAAHNIERDQRDDRSVSARRLLPEYVSPEMTGIEDLDRNGRWEQNADYGALWIPRAMAPGWAPYAVGHWAFVQPWGWTWIDDAPWGFAPFHYGRWVFLRNTWCWAPGTFVARPVYAPALVAWVGGPRVSVGISIGGGGNAGGNFGASVGWFPLAPREIYVPSYRVSPRYVEQVNITQVTNITNITTIINNPQAAVRDIDFSNRKFHHAITTVPEAVMTGRENVAPAAAQWRAANPGRYESQDRNEANPRGARRDESRRGAPASLAPMMTMAAPPVAAPVAVNPAREPTRPREMSATAPSMTAPSMAAPSMAPPLAAPQTGRPGNRSSDDGLPAQRVQAERPLRERGADTNRPAVSPAAPPTMSAPAVMSSPTVPSRSAPGQRAGTANEPRMNPRPVPSQSAAQAAPAAAPAPAAAARMEAPRAPSREGPAAETRKRSQDEKAEKGEGRRNNAPRAVE